MFKLGKVVYERLVKADLRDRVVFRFDPSQVTTIEFRGWQNLGLGEQKMKLVKNASGGWDATVNDKPVSFALDPIEGGSIPPRLDTRAGEDIPRDELPRRTNTGSARIP